MLTKKLTLALLTSTSLFALQAQAKQIDFHIEGINDSKGKLYIQLFKGEDNYKQGKPAAATIVSAQENTAFVSFENLEAGEYAVRFFHDENDNGELETNLFGMPTEGYGFSNNARPNLGPVSYDEVKFTLTDQQSSVSNTTNVIY